MTRIRIVVILSLVAVWLPGAAWAQPSIDTGGEFESAVTFLPAAPAPEMSTTDGVLSARPWHLAFQPPAPTAPAPHVALSVAAATDQAATAARPVAFEYSDAYYTRLKIHRYASFATLPLFVTEYVLGQKLYDLDYGNGTKSAHSAIAATLGVLFGVNSVTGVWNMWEGRKDPTHHGKRLTHGILMLASDAGFLATGLTAPNLEEGTGNRGTHRAIALTSMALATTGYLMMLFH